MMETTNPIVTIKNQKAVTTSLEIARVFRKKHSYVLNAVKKTMEGLAKYGFFHRGSFKDVIVQGPNGRKRIAIEIDSLGLDYLIMVLRPLSMHTQLIEFFSVFRTVKDILFRNKMEKQRQKLYNRTIESEDTCWFNV